MEHYGVVLKRLRLIRKLPIKTAAAQIGRSAGWLSEVENSKGFARITPEEFNRIVTAYAGDVYRKQFGSWIGKELQANNKAAAPSFDGSILKYLRAKSGLTLEAVSKASGLSCGYISRLESGAKTLSLSLRNRLLQVYGYSPSSFKNFTSEDKRAKNIPAKFKLDILLRQMGQENIERVFSFALQVLNSNAVLNQEAL
jgi:transcriptional regulator with XRE-family HTH domain